MIHIDPQTLNACIVRGDSGIITVRNNTRNFETGDKIYLTVKKGINEDVLFQIEVTSFNVDGTCTIDIKPEDTETVEPAEYLYDITWIDANGNTNTLINDCDIPTFTIKRGTTNG